MKRNIFNTSDIETIQQGCIFFGGIADGIQYPVHGLIITPRCDIANEKVSNINYLPITTLKDWITNDLIPAYRTEEGSKKKMKINEQLKKLDQKISLEVTHKMPEESINKLFPDPKYKQLVADIISYWELFDNDVCQESVKKWKNYNNRISELSKGKMERYLLLEHWNNDKNQFYVIHLTQVKHISISTSKTLIKGLPTRLIDREKDDLYIDDRLSSSNYKVVAQLTSPYIEYVCQKFSNAFFRIGIEDWPHKDITGIVMDSI